MELQTKPAKPANHPWMEKSRSRIHVDHAINFLGTNWLVLVDAYSKYPCIHPTMSTSTVATTNLLKQDFTHFGYCLRQCYNFVFGEVSSMVSGKGHYSPHKAPYHPATNGAAERLVHTIKQALVKSSLPPKTALQSFSCSTVGIPWQWIFPKRVPQRSPNKEQN